MGQYDKLLGTLLVGIFINTFLFGIASMQYISYFTKRFDDSMAVKVGVTLLLLNDTFQGATMLYMAWVYCVENFNNPDILKTYIWPFSYVPIGTALVALATHILMTYRIYYMTKRKVICGILLVMSVGALGLGVAYGSVTLSSPAISQRRTLKRIVAGWLGIQALLDVSIAGCLIFFLHQQRTKSSNCNTVINRLIQGAMQTCLLPATFAVAGLVAFVSSPRTSIFTTFVIPIGRAYTITLMDGLNIRAELKDKLLKEGEMNVESGLVWADPTKTSRRQPSGTSIAQDMLRSLRAPPSRDGATSVRDAFTLAAAAKSSKLGISEESYKSASLDSQRPVIVLQPESAYRTPSSWD